MENYLDFASSVFDFPSFDQEPSGVIDTNTTTSSTITSNSEADQMQASFETPMADSSNDDQEDLYGLSPHVAPRQTVSPAVAGPATKQLPVVFTELLGITQEAADKFAADTKELAAKYPGPPLASDTWTGLDELHLNDCQLSGQQQSFDQQQQLSQEQSFGQWQPFGQGEPNAFSVNEMVMPPAQQPPAPHSLDAVAEWNRTQGLAVNNASAFGAGQPNAIPNYFLTMLQVQQPAAPQPPADKPADNRDAQRWFAPTSDKDRRRRPIRSLGPRPPAATASPSTSQSSVSSNAATPAAPTTPPVQRTGNRMGQRRGLPQAQKQHKRFCNPNLGCQDDQPGTFECPFKKDHIDQWRQWSARNWLWKHL
jgi:hypothetical protein